MKIGYACINQSLQCRSNRTFRLKNYSKERLIEVIEGNLNCLFKILEFNKLNGINFFRITSDLTPFASHAIMDYNWQDDFKPTFIKLGNFIAENQMRISMHPSQYSVLNSIKEDIYQKNVKELRYHVEVLDLMKFDDSAKVQIHVGGVYGNKEKSMERLIERYQGIDDQIKNRLIIENDDKPYTLRNCLSIYDDIKIPIVFDT